MPHRHKHFGPWRAYILARVLPPGGTFDVSLAQHRRFEGRTFTPPFVAVRRTSAPGDQSRAVATIVTGEQKVAVENHLLVLEPRDRSLESCKRVLKVLTNIRTKEWLDQRIRCRHLTVGSLRDLPWWEPENAD